jgi:hypothetical protein
MTSEGFQTRDLAKYRALIKLTAEDGTGRQSGDVSPELRLFRLKSTQRIATSALSVTFFRIRYKTLLRN